MTGAAPPPAPAAAPPIGLIAGSGRFPLLFAEAAARAGREVIAVAHEGETEAALAGLAPRCTWVRLGQLGRIVEVLRAAGCAEAVFCGGIRKPRLFDVRPDWLGLKVLAGLRSFGDDAALRAIASALEAEGVRIVSPLPLMPGLLAPRGPFGKRVLSVEQRAAVEVGPRAARLLGDLDLGQTVVVKRGVVLAVEAIEGTDACIVRGGQLATGSGHGAVVVKVQKPTQDERFDLLAVGPKTVAALRAAGCSALAVEAGRALVLDRPALTAAADAAGIAVEGV
ncbi:MAG: UDP-2,3-diacylglucosamine diphosphatase LpxI [Myxococcales bacterium]